MDESPEAARRKDLRALKTQRESLERQRSSILGKLQKMRASRETAVAGAAKAVDRVAAARDRVAQAKAKLDAIVARNSQVAKAKELMEKMGPPLSPHAPMAYARSKAAKLLTEQKEAEAKAIETGTRGGRYYVNAQGTKVYVK